jgi:hypothetical protein
MELSTRPEGSLRALQPSFAHYIISYILGEEIKGLPRAAANSKENLIFPR